MYILVGSTTSPYVRKLRLYFAQNNIPFEFKSINYLEDKDARYLREINPINKIPVLIDDNKPIFDSRVIFNYINKKHILQSLSIEEENILSAIDGAMDTSINLFSLKRGGLDVTSILNPFVVRQNERVPLILDYLRPWIKSLNEKTMLEWNFLTMSLYSYLFWAKARNILDYSNDLDCNQFIAKYEKAPHIEETAFIP